MASYGWKTWQMCLLVLAVSFFINAATSQIMKPVYGLILQALVRLAESNDVPMHHVVKVDGQANDTNFDVLS